MSDQRPLISPDQLPPAKDAPPLAADASIQAALGLFETHMRHEGFAVNTMKAFASDVRLLGKYLGIGQPIGEIGTNNLNDFLKWLLEERGVPCSPKSYARRVTTLKVFFGWLHEAGVLPTDPSAAVIQRSVKSPLPTIPTESDLEKALAVTQAMRQGGQEQKPDARPHLLLTLLLQTGIKKGEAMAIVPNHIDRSNTEQPMLFIRYANPRLRYKERKLPLEPEWLDVLDEYLTQYEPPDTLFTCTPRNLEYILRDVGDDAGLERGLLSFENLRWASTIRDWRAKVEQDDIRQKLGLSKITWRETKSKLERLTESESDSEA
ncbi:MAG: phage integrase N-terminal SAM-like domain-containing protein [Anaerolineales bacterium]|nr:phage integrase N-terminal SAM-like domain-containing protein [Anaerolineales bacterium]